MKDSNSKKVTQLYDALLEITKGNNQLSVLKSLSKELSNYIRSKADSVEIISAAPLSVSQKRMIEDKLFASSANGIKPYYFVDPEIVGGIIIKMGDTVYNYSVQNQLNQIKNTL